FFQAEDGIRDYKVTEFRRVLFRSDKYEPTRVDSRLLLGIQLHARLTRHIGASSHHVGQSPCFGSCRTSPLRMRSTIPTASPRARSEERRVGKERRRARGGGRAVRR